MYVTYVCMYVLYLFSGICASKNNKQFSSNKILPGMASSESDNSRWLMLGHEIIFEKIMLIVVFESLESLHCCRQVCSTWNIMIMNMIYENPTKKWGTIIQKRIELSWDIENNYPSDKQISQAKLLGNNTQFNY